MLPSLVSTETKVREPRAGGCRRSRLGRLSELTRPGGPGERAPFSGYGIRWARGAALGKVALGKVALGKEALGKEALGKVALS